MLDPPYPSFLLKYNIKKCTKHKYTDQWIIANEYLSNQCPQREAMFKNDMCVPSPSIHLSTKWDIGMLSPHAHLSFLPYCRQIMFGFVSQNDFLFGEVLLYQQCQGYTAAGSILSPHFPVFCQSRPTFVSCFVCFVILVTTRGSHLF